MISRGFLKLARLRRISPIELYAGLLTALAVMLAVGLPAAGFPLSAERVAWPLLGFAVLAMLVERQSIEIAPGLQVSVAFLPLVFVEVVYGPVAAVLVGAATMLPEFPLRRTGPAMANVDRPYLRWLVWTASRVIVAAIGGLAAFQAFAMVDNRPAAVAVATAAATIANFGLELTLTGITLTLRETGGRREVARAAWRIAVVGAPVYSAVAAIVAYAYTEITPWSAVFFFVPALAAQRLFVLWRKQEDALRDLGDAYRTLEKANLSFATALVATLDARDRYTAGHSTAVAVYARDIARRLGLAEDVQKTAHLCGLVHDIGKIGLSPGLLEKPGTLTSDERSEMEQHSAIGEGILANVDGYGEIAKIVRHHHERLDGTGYPDKIAFDDIPLISRIIAVADAYDAMTSDRPYRSAMPSAVARVRLIEAAGDQFDPEVVDAFEAVLASSSERYRRRAGVDVWTARESVPHPGVVLVRA